MSPPTSAIGPPRRCRRSSTSTITSIKTLSSRSPKETSARLAKELQDAGAKVTTGVGGYGVVGVLENGPGKTLLLRTDMDALPVAEQTGLPFASTVRTKTSKAAPSASCTPAVTIST